MKLIHKIEGNDKFEKLIVNYEWNRIKKMKYLESMSGIIIIIIIILITNN